MLQIFMFFFCSFFHNIYFDLATVFPMTIYANASNVHLHTHTNTQTLEHTLIYNVLDTIESDRSLSACNLQLLLDCFSPYCHFGFAPFLMLFVVGVAAQLQHLLLLLLLLILQLLLRCCCCCCRYQCCCQLASFGSKTKTKHTTRCPMAAK